MVDDDIYPAGTTVLVSGFGLAVVVDVEIDDDGLRYLVQSSEDHEVMHVDARDVRAIV